MKKNLIFVVSVLILAAFIYALIYFTQKSEDKKYKDFDAVFKKIKIDVELKNDGTVIYNYSHQLKLNTYFAFHRQYGESFIVYNPQWQKLTILKSETTMADGKKVSSPDNAYNEVLPSFAQNSASYNHLREMVVTHTALERNATIDFAYSLETKKGFMPCFMIHEACAKSSPVQNYEFSVTVPSDKKIDYQTFSFESNPSIQIRGNKMVYIWKLNNLKPISNERNFLQTAPSISVFDADFNLKSFLDSVFNSDKLTVNEKNSFGILFDKQDSLTLLETIGKNVNSRLVTLQVPDAYSGFKYRTVNEILKSANATNGEKYKVYCSLLNAYEFNYRVAGLIPRNADSSKICLADIVDFLIAVNVHNNVFLVSPQSGKIEHINNINPHYKLFNVIAPANELRGKCSAYYKIHITDQNISGVAKIVLNGQCNNYYRFKNANNPIQDVISNINYTKVKLDYKNISLDSTVMQISFNDIPFNENIDNVLIWNIPEFKTGFYSWSIPYLDYNRYTDFYLPCFLDEKTEFEISTDKNISLLKQNFPVYSENQMISYITDYDSVQNKVIRVLSFKTNTIKADKYNEFRKVLNLYLSPANKRLLFIHNNTK